MALPSIIQSNPLVDDFAFLVYGYATAVGSRITSESFRDTHTIQESPKVKSSDVILCCSKSEVTQAQERWISKLFHPRFLQIREREREREREGRWGGVSKREQPKAKQNHPISYLREGLITRYPKHRYSSICEGFQGLELALATIVNSSTECTREEGQNDLLALVVTELHIHITWWEERKRNSCFLANSTVRETTSTRTLETYLQLSTRSLVPLRLR